MKIQVPLVPTVLVLIVVQLGEVKLVAAWIQ